MNVVVVGGHGQIALRLLRILAERGDTARGVIRDPGQAADLEEVGAEAIVCDIESEPLIEAVVGADAVVFAAGAGPGSGPERKQTVDLGGAVKLIDAAKANDVRRYVIVSSIGAHDPSIADGDFRAYLQAKHDADEALIASGLDYTVVRPGSLTDDAGHREGGHQHRARAAGRGAARRRGGGARRMPRRRRGRRQGLRAVRRRHAGGRRGPRPLARALTSCRRGRRARP